MRSSSGVHLVLATAAFLLLACSGVAQASSASRLRSSTSEEDGDNHRRSLRVVEQASPPPASTQGLAGLGPFGAWFLLTSVANAQPQPRDSLVLPGVYGVYGGELARQASSIVNSQVQDVLSGLTSQFQSLQDSVARGTTTGQDIFCGAWQGMQLAQRMYDTISTAAPLATTALAGNVGTFLQATNLLVPQTVAARYNNDCKAFAPAPSDTLGSYLSSTLGNTPFTEFLTTTLGPLDNWYQQAQAQVKQSGTTTSTGTASQPTGLSGWLQNLAGTTAPTTTPTSTTTAAAPTTLPGFLTQWLQPSASAATTTSTTGAAARTDGLTLPPWLRLLTNSSAFAPPAWTGAGRGSIVNATLAQAFPLLANATARLTEAANATATSGTLFRRQP